MISFLFLTIQNFAIVIDTIKKPNVIYILCDDLGYGEVGYNGQNLIHTPELDKLAYSGMIFTDHYCGNAVCAPSRASLLTGMHPGHAYIRANSPGYPNGQTPLPENTETIGKLMKEQVIIPPVLVSGDWVLSVTQEIQINTDLIYFMGILTSVKLTITIHNIYG